MKKTLFLLFLASISFQFIQAQEIDAYVSAQGGEKKILLFGKIGYNEYYFHAKSDQTTDTLICKGVGFEKCRMKKLSKDALSHKKKIAIMNKAIYKSIRKTSKTDTANGEFDFKIKGNDVAVKYAHADQKGNVDLLINIEHDEINNAYVSAQGGKKKALLLGKNGYNEYRFRSCYNSSMDSLICRGIGYQKCRMPTKIYDELSHAEKIVIENKAIRRSMRKIKKMEMNEGELNLKIKGREVEVHYCNVDHKGNADLRISILDE